MTNTLDLVKNINTLLSLYVLRIKASIDSGLLDSARASEKVFLPVLSEVYSLDNLEDLNSRKANFPGIDLGDSEKKIGFQITATKNTKKIYKTLKTFFNHDLHKEFDQIYIFIVTEKQQSYQSKSISKICAEHNFYFDLESHILDYQDICRRLGSLSFDALVRIKSILYQELVYIESTENFKLIIQPNRELSKLSDETTELQIEKTNKYLIRGDFEKAIYTAQNSLENNKQDIKLLYALASAHFGLYRYDECLSIINKALLISPEDKYVQILKAATLHEIGVSKSSEVCFIEAAEILESVIPCNEWRVYYNLGNVYSSLSKYSEAKNCFLESISLDPSHPEVYCNLANTYHKLGEHSLELESFDKALKVFPGHVPSLSNKAVSLMKDHGLIDEAIELFRRAIEIDPDRLVREELVWYWYAYALLQRESYQESIRYVDFGLSYHPNSLYLISLKCKIYLSKAHKNPEFISDAIRFLDKYDTVLTSEQAIYSQIEISKIFFEIGNEDDAWDTIDGVFPEKIMGYKYSKILKVLDISLPVFFKATPYIPLYFNYRQNNRVGTYSYVDYLPGIISTVSSFYAIVFGLTMSKFDGSKQTEFLCLTVSDFILKELMKLTKLFDLFLDYMLQNDDDVTDVSEGIAKLCIMFDSLVIPEVISVSARLYAFSRYESDLLSTKLEEVDDKSHLFNSSGIEDEYKSVWLERAIELARKRLDS